MNLSFVTTFAAIRRLAVGGLSLLVALAGIGPIQAQDLVISEPQFDPAGRAVLRVTAVPGTYSVLYRGATVEDVNTPIAAEEDPNTGQGSSVIELIDPESSFESETRFFRVGQWPLETPQDHDGDGIDDVFELRNRHVLNAVNPADAELDPDEDRRSHLEEYLVGSSLHTYDVAAAAAPAYPMPTVNTPFDPNPTNPQISLVQKLLVYAADTDGTAIPVKTIALKNNAPFTVFPVLRDGNEASTSVNTNVGLYDPYDPVRMEYRGYIGYQGADNKFYFGLQQGQTIIIRVPLVFWNGARMGIVTDGRYLAPAVGQPNPLHYDPNSQRVIATAEAPSGPPNPKSHGVVMWYRAGLQAPALDSPDQLLEWTIRDRVYLSNPKINARSFNEIPLREKVTLINYDVSYVDNMFLPVAMEALDVPVPAPPEPFNQNRGPFGWIGSTNTPTALQAKIKAFTSSNNTLLGAYFGTNGWPEYNMPPDAIGERKIPAAQNIFAQSPLAGALSSYDVLNNHFMLSSGGSTPIRVNIGGQGTASSGTTLTLSPNEDVNKVKLVQAGDTVVGYPPSGKTNPIVPGTKVKRVIHVSTGPGDPSLLELNTALVASQDGANFDFYRPVDDYASAALIKLWFSWVKHYLTLTQNTATQTAIGAVETDRATLTLAGPVNGLIEGMQVTGPGLDSPDPAKEKGGVIILAVATDKRSVVLSQLARANHPLSQNQTYTFLKPQPLRGAPAELFTFNFSQDPQDSARNPDEFSKKVYLAMASMAQIGKNLDPKVKTPYVLELMNNVVGGNMGFIFDTNARRFTPDGLAISARIRDIIKSILRGVTDFMRHPEYNANNTLVWYPTPSTPRGGLPFNAYNLDPFVWFVHVPLGFSGYGFSLDDDTADVGAGEATRLQVTIGGRAGLPNTNEWTIQAVYGPVTGGGHWDPSKTVSFYDAITGATRASPIVITALKHNLADGEKVHIDQVEGNTAANGTWTVANATANTFELVGSSGNADYLKGGRWSRGPLPFISGVNSTNVYWKLKGDDRDAGFTGALVSGPGVLRKGVVRVAQLGDDKLAILALNTFLTNSSGGLLPAGNYTWTLSGK